MHGMCGYWAARWALDWLAKNVRLLTGTTPLFLAYQSQFRLTRFRADVAFRRENFAILFRRQFPGSSIISLFGLLEAFVRITKAGPSQNALLSAARPLMVFEDSSPLVK